MTIINNTKKHKDADKFRAQRQEVISESTCHYAGLGAEMLAVFDAPKNINDAEKKYSPNFVHAATFIGRRARRLAGQWAELTTHEREKVCVFENTKERSKFLTKYKYAYLQKHLKEFAALLDKAGVAKDNKSRFYQMTNANTFHLVYTYDHNFDTTDKGRLDNCMSNLQKNAAYLIPKLEKMVMPMILKVSLKDVGRKAGEKAVAEKPVYSPPVIPPAKENNIVHSSNGDIPNAFC